ncbi:MAG TPA: dihydrodipicolinate reductase [Mycobacterium sp.]|nr:dihydrodipicolinate reductase [Mycobacterium sp.]
MYRVIQWATGGVGKAAIQAVLRHPELDLVGCWVHSADKSGRDVGELAGEDPIGVLATNDIDELLALDADCVMYSPLLPDDQVVIRILQSGKNVVTPVGWVYPDRQSPAVAAIEAACVAGNVTLHGSGIHPGGITERFPLMVSSLSSAITHVRAEEFSDLRTYNAPMVVREVMGFGLTPEQAMGGPMAVLLEAGFKQSVRMVTDQLGFDAEPRIRSTQEVAVAVTGSDELIVPMEPGTVAARRFRWEAIVDDRPVVTAAVNWLMCEVELDPPWTLGEQGERFEVEITGDPPVSLTFKGLQPESVAEGLIRNPGVVATANHCVSAIPYVCAAESGIKTYLDLPLIAGRAAPDLAAGRSPRRAD